MIIVSLFLLLITYLCARPLIRAFRADKVTDGAVAWGGFVLILGILFDVVVVVFLNYYVDYLWFAEVQDQAQRFWQGFIIYWQLFGWLFLAGFSVAAFSLGAAQAVVTKWQTAEEEFNWNGLWAVLFGGATYGLFAGLVLAALGSSIDWTTFLRYLYHEPGGATDPVLGLPLSFYLFKLPFYESLMAFVFVLMLFCIPAILILSRKKRRGAVGKVGDLVLTTEIGFFAAGVLVYFGLLALLWRVQLVYGSHTGNIHGIDYLRHTVSVPGLQYLAWIMFFLAAVTFVVSLLRRQYTTMTVIGSGVTVVLGVVVYFAAMLVVHLGWNKPNHFAVNRPYVQHTMEWTREAFNIGSTIDERAFPINNTMTATDLEANAATLDAARIWDYTALDQRITQTQVIRPFYDFLDIDLVRYTDEAGRIYPVMSSLRNLNVSQLPASASATWINTDLRYTHGYGLVVSPVNEFTGNGEPVYYAGDMDGAVNAPFDLKIEEPRIYYGNGYTGAVFVNANGIDEFDRPGDSRDFSNRYACDGGIVLSNFMRRFAAGWESGRIFQALTSEYFSKETRMLINRDVSTRIAELVPFMLADPDWYVVVHEGRLVAIQDLYTTSDYYPFAERVGEVRYIRGAAKATVDLCDGVVNFYTFDEQDPIMATYEAAFPDLFQPRSAMPDGLQAHARYPEQLFLRQHAAYGEYHVTDIQRFYNSSDVWSTPTEWSRGKEVKMAARYVVAELPAGKVIEDAEAAEAELEAVTNGPEFILMRPYVFKFGGAESKSRPRMTGWLAGLSDGENYGRLVAYHFPGDAHVHGTAHIEQTIEQYEPFQQSFLQWNRQDSPGRWFRGNLIVLPLVGGQLVAFEPIYTEAGDGELPELKRVISVQLRAGLEESSRIVWGNTYTESRQALVGYARSVGLLQEGEGSDLTEEELLILVYERLSSYSALTGDGQFTAAGEQLDAAMSQLREYMGTGEDHSELVD